MKRVRLTRIALLAVMAGLITGCESDRVPVYPVSGRVTINGKPPVGWVAVLHLEPAPDPSKRYPHPLPKALVGADGRFQIHTYGIDDGAPAGTYKISFMNLGGGAMVDMENKEGKDATGEKKSQVYWPDVIEIRPEPNELSAFDIKTK